MHLVTAGRPKHLTIRGLPEDIAHMLKAEARRQGQSLNETVKSVLRRGLGLHETEPYDNGLRALAGTWNDEQLATFERAAACFEEIDEDLWS
jgi:plasmid stability protein